MSIEQYRKRFFNLMESTMGDVRPLINEQDKNVHDPYSPDLSSQDPQDPYSHFGYIEKSLIPKGFKKNDSMLKQVGSIDLEYNSSGHKGIIVRYNSPYHKTSKQYPAVQLIVNNNVVKTWKTLNSREDASNVINDVNSYIK